jgi:hypothetical protein
MAMWAIAAMPGMMGAKRTIPPPSRSKVLLTVAMRDATCCSGVARAKELS